MRKPHTYHPQSRDAAKVLGNQIAAARRERRWTSANLAERAGISVVTLRKIERGDLSVAIGSVFEVATLLGVPLFTPDRRELGWALAQSEQRLALIPSRVRARRTVVSDAF
ncbi:MAG: helix-turn-helix transcriptional regulator [Actinomycetes bacterium]